MKKRIGFLLAGFAVLSINGCAPSAQSEASAEESPSVEQIEAPPSKPEYVPYGSLPWEEGKADRKAWSNYLFSLIDQEAPDLINGAQDMDLFCPKYSRLLRAEKVQFWAQLIVQLSKYESRYNPVLRYHEKGRKDAVTGRDLYSEGLLQLSYQDKTMMPHCHFDWERDKNFSGTDSRKSIFDPFRNLRCGVLILNRQLHRFDKIVLNGSAYWAVIKGNSQYSKIPAIQKHLNSLSYCK